jgi:uncharacterized BrkB/YihY/UPF0761 family membrane protein
MAVFIKHNLALKGDLHLASMFVLLFTANGIFEPLEVALNRTWGVKKNRPYWQNQAVSLGMIFACGALALLSVLFSAMNRGWVTGAAGSIHWLEPWLNLLLFKVAAVPLSILSLFLIYWLLPNRKIPPARVVPVAIYVGLILEAMKYVNLALSPWLEAKFEHEYFIFRHSVTILIWSFLAALIVLAGAEWTAREDTADPLS